MKVSIIGVGNVGAVTALKLSDCAYINELVLLDIKEGLAEGTAKDIKGSLSLSKKEKFNIIGVTNDYSKTVDSDIIVITSGSPRKPGMSREDLVASNSKIVCPIITKCYNYSKNAIYIIVSNPIDTMSYMAVKLLSNLSGKDYSSKVLGFGNSLDCHRFENNLSLNIINKISDTENGNYLVFGGHGDSTMIPAVIGCDFNDFTPEELKELNNAIETTKVEGKTITEIKGSSAYLGPGTILADDISYLIENLINKDINPVTFQKIGEYSFYLKDFDICIGVPVYFNTIENKFVEDKHLLQYLIHQYENEWKNAINKIEITNKCIIWPD